ncbi:8256_t:CDS:2 [Gigaspora margarita]|uniref:8256_t:CDS:1 n=1 Tax=Gigaspora margarita TaxID=4874 RepID=A0ABN7VQM0_GIGMA|nr:8256_t:CDS:2 [Gigaspora margarita]
MLSKNRKQKLGYQQNEIDMPPKSMNTSCKSINQNDIENTDANNTDDNTQCSIHEIAESPS